MFAVHWKSAIVVKMKKTAGCDSFTGQLKKKNTHKKNPDISTTTPTVGCLVRLYLFMKSHLDRDLFFFFFLTEEWITQIERSRQTGVENRMCQIKVCTDNLDQDHIVDIGNAAKKTVAFEGWKKSLAPSTPSGSRSGPDGCQENKNQELAIGAEKKQKNLRTGDTNEDKEVFSLNKMAQRPILFVQKLRGEVSDPGI